MTLELTKTQASLLLTAVIEKRMETKRYLSSADVPEVPEEQHACCDWHRMRYDRMKGEKHSLQARYDVETELIRILEELV